MREPLSSPEIHALRTLADGSVRTLIDSRHAQLFIDLGYARESADGIAVTRRGRRVAAAYAAAGVHGRARGRSIRASVHPLPKHA